IPVAEPPGPVLHGRLRAGLEDLDRRVGGSRALVEQAGVDRSGRKLRLPEDRVKVGPVRLHARQRGGGQRRSQLGDRFGAGRGAPRTSTVSPRAGVSSMTFWLRRCSEQSRSPSATTPPRPSPKIWTSTWRARSTSFSRKRPLSLKLFRANLSTASNAPASSSG